MNGPGERSVQALADLVEVLHTAEVEASTDPSEVNVGDGGGAWVTVTALRPRTLAGGWQADVAVYLIARDAGTAEALRDLGDLLDAVLSVLDPDEDITTESVQLPGTAPLPAYRVPITLDF